MSGSADKNEGAITTIFAAGHDRLTSSQVMLQGFAITSERRPEVIPSRVDHDDVGGVNHPIGPEACQSVERTR